MEKVLAGNASPAEEAIGRIAALDGDGGEWLSEDDFALAKEQGTGTPPFRVPRNFQELAGWTEALNEIAALSDSTVGSRTLSSDEDFQKKFISSALSAAPNDIQEIKGVKSCKDIYELHVRLLELAATGEVDSNEWRKLVADMSDTLGQLESSPQMQGYFQLITTNRFPIDGITKGTSEYNAIKEFVDWLRIKDRPALKAVARLIEDKLKNGRIHMSPYSMSQLKLPGYIDVCYPEDIVLARDFFRSDITVDNAHEAMAAIFSGNEYGKSGSPPQSPTINEPALQKEFNDIEMFSPKLLLALPIESALKHIVQGFLTRGPRYQSKFMSANRRLLRRMNLSNDNAAKEASNAGAQLLAKGFKQSREKPAWQTILIHEFLHTVQFSKKEAPKELTDLAEMICGARDKSSQEECSERFQDLSLADRPEYKKWEKQMFDIHNNPFMLLCDSGGDSHMIDITYFHNRKEMSADFVSQILFSLANAD